MTRIPTITDRAELTADGQRVYDAIAGTRGVVRGPFGVLLHVPPLADEMQKVGAYLRYRSLLPDALRETVILATAKLHECAFEWSAHRPVAAAAGVDGATLACLEAGRFDELTGDAALAVSYARELVLRHRVPDELFERARARFSTPELVELSALIGYYGGVAAILNAFEVDPL